MKLKDWTVDILGKRFSVKWRKVGGGKDFGQCVSTKCEIVIDPNVHVDQQKDTLIHECLHAIDHEMDTGLRERQIRLIATGLLHFIRSNPELIKYVAER